MTVGGAVSIEGGYVRKFSNLLGIPFPRSVSSAGRSGIYVYRIQDAGEPPEFDIGIREEQ